MDWSPIYEKLKNSVLQILVNSAQYDVDRPYSNPIDRSCKGTGFIVDIDRGLVVTNAHVIANAISIDARSTITGKRDLHMKLIGISRERDLALCELSKESIEAITEDTKTPEIFNMKLGDNMLLDPGEEVIVMGYPLGKENIKVTSGVISGFQYEDDLECNELQLEKPSFIQITAAINPGNSGGPLINREGKVVGIVAAGYFLMQNIGYAIGTRTLITIFDGLLKGGHLITPSFSFEYTRTNSTIIKEKCGDPNYCGIYVTNILQDSIFTSLEEGDILHRIIFMDPFWDNELAFNITDLGKNRTLIMKEPSLVMANIDNYGDILLYKYDEHAEGNYGRKLLNRRIELDELRDIIPLGSELLMLVCRESKWKILRGNKYIAADIYKIKLEYLNMNPIKYDIIAGLVISTLTLNYIDAHIHDKSLLKYCSNDNAFIPYLVITKIFPNTTAYQTKSLESGDIIKEINGIKVLTIEDLRKAIRSTNRTFTIKTLKRKYFAVDKTTMINEDKLILKNYHIASYKYLF